jgi:hypothetical protein
MSMIRASANDQEGPLRESLSARSGKTVSDKPARSKKSSAVNIHTPAPGGVEQEGPMTYANGDVRARIAERAYELYHRRGGHHGQDLDDWFTAERETFAEDSQ